MLGSLVELVVEPSHGLLERFYRLREMLVIWVGGVSWLDRSDRFKKTGGRREHRGRWVAGGGVPGGGCGTFDVLRMVAG